MAPAPPAPSRDQARRGAIAAGAVVALAGAAGWQLVGIARAAHGLPPWDMATHGLAGLDLATALRHGDLPGFLAAINAQATWPFVHSLLLLPFFLALGDGYWVAGAASACFYAATALAAFFAADSLHPRRGPWVGALAAALVLVAPLYRLFGTLAMTEMPGALLLALAIGAAARALQHPDSPRRAAWAGGLTAALFLTKYNYGLLWIAALVARELATLDAGGRARLRSALRPTAFKLFVLAYALGLAAIVVSGGGAFRLWGQRVSVRSAGNPAYLLLVIVVVRLAWWGLRRRADAAAWWRGLSPLHRGLLACGALPIAVWLLVPYPNRVKELVGFVVNRRSEGGLASLDTWLFYPRAFLRDYSPSPWVGGLVLALAAIPPRRPGGPGVSLLRWSALISAVATALHPYRESRFLFTAALPIWLCAAWNAVAWLEAALERWAPTGRRPVWALALAAPLLGAVWGSPAAEGTRARHQALMTPTTLEPLLDAVGGVAAAEPRSVLLGWSDHLSPALLAWHLQRTRPALGRSRLPDRLSGLPPTAGDREAGERVAALTRRGLPVLAIWPLQGSYYASPEHSGTARGDSLTEAALRRDPRWREDARRVIRGAGYRLSVWRRAEP